MSSRSCIDTCMDTVHTRDMNSTEARSQIATAVAARTELMQVALKATGRRASAAWRAVEAADSDVNYAVRSLEMALRVEMVGATEAEIQTAAQAA